MPNEPATPFDSKQFELRYEECAKARWLGPTDAPTIAELYNLFRRERWRGQFVINFPGNGGVNDITFTEVRRKTAAAAEATAPAPKK